MTRLASSALLLPFLAASALAQDGGSPAAPVADYRWAVYTACTLVFLSIIVYLVSAHRRMTRAAGEVAHLERRVERLEDDA